MPKTSTTNSLLLALALAGGAAGHGYMTNPPSRNYEAWKANADRPAGAAAEYEPHSIRAAGVYSECEGCPARGSKTSHGANPWSAPGTASTLGYPTQAGIQGVCGGAWTADLDYNSPSPFNVWGTEALTTYAPGQTIDVEWCVAADHGGIPQFRLCSDPALVAKLTTPGYVPTLEEHEEIEACFQEGLLRCDGVDGATCPQVWDCDAYPEWEACEPGKYTFCTENGDKCRNTAETCPHGTLARHTLKIPGDFPESAHTVMSWRWDCYVNQETFAGCADIKIEAAGNTATRAPTPRLRGSAQPTVKPTSTQTTTPPPPTDDNCECRSIVEHISDEWCQGVSCDAAYSEFCSASCDDVDDDFEPEPTAKPTTKPTTMSTAEAAPTPAPTDAPFSEPTAKPTEAAATDDATDDAPCGCRSISHVSDSWCQGVMCDSAYSAFCSDSCADDDATAKPTTKPTTKPAVPTPRPTTAAPVPKPTVRPTAEGETAKPTPPKTTDDFAIMGYVENWKSFSDTSKFDSYTHLLYSFLTLDPRPNPDRPRDMQWDGEAVYETMTLADVLDVMQLCDGCAPYENPHNWQRQKIVNLMNYCAANGKTFLWAFGGWSDLKRTIADDQVDTLVAMLVELLETVGGDGIDFDWEHLSEYKGVDAALHAQQRQIVGKVIVALKAELVARGMADKLITYTPRYNAFIQGGSYNTNQFRTDGEGIDVVSYVQANSPYGVDAIDFVHYMMYDINAQEGFKDAPEKYFSLHHYEAVIASSLEYIPASKIVMGFEPGPQAYTGVSGGIEHEKAIIAAIKDRVGGIMFWAANEAAVSSLNGKTTGENSGTLAAYAAGLVA